MNVRALLRSFLLPFPPLACLFLSACANRPVHAGVDYLVARECKPQVHLIDCDRSSPPRCKRMAADFPKGCEQLVAKQ